MRTPATGDVSSLVVEEVQRIRSLGARGVGAEITSEPIVQMKARRAHKHAFAHRGVRSRILRRIAPFPSLITASFLLLPHTRSFLSFRCAVQGLDKFTTALVTRVEARDGGSGGSSTLRTRVRVEAALFGVQRTHTARLNLSMHCPECMP